MISQKSIQQVLDIARVDDVIQDYVNLRRAGVNMVGLCPFHDEKTPSFSVSPTKNIYKCFGCGKGGGPVQFVMEHDGMSWPEAIKHLAKKYNITIEETGSISPEEQKEKQLNQSLIIVNEFAQSYFEDILWNNQEGKSIGLSYFKERGFRENIIKKFQLGFATKTYDAFTKSAIEKKYNIEHLRALGLTTSRDLDFFKDRVMFTIWNITGKPIAFAGRTLKSDKKIPKYINSPESVIYNKRKVLYGIHLAKNAIRKEDVCYLTEGYTDVISLHQGGIENVVASSGTALTKDQVRLVKRYTNNMTILYDGDSAGIKAAMRGLDIVLSQGMNVKLVILPEGEDPDSFMSQVGKEGFKQYISDNEKDFIIYKTELILNETANDPIQRGRYLKDIVVSLSQIRDSITRAFYIKNCSQRLEMDEAIIVKETNKQIRENIRQEKLEKQRAARRAENARNNPQRNNASNFPTQEGPINNEAPLPNASDGNMPPLPEQAPMPVNEEDWIQDDIAYAHKQQRIPVASDEFQEKDLARIVVTLGDKIMEYEEEQIPVASFIYSSIFDVIEYFEKPIYKQIITEAFELVERGKFSNQYFINHQEEAIRNLTIDFLSPKYEFAKWGSKHDIGLFQKEPEKNFYEDSYQAILRYKFRKVKKIIKQLQKRIKDLEGGDDTETFIISLKALNKLQEDKKSIAKELRTNVG